MENKTKEWGLGDGLVAVNEKGWTGEELTKLWGVGLDDLVSLDKKGFSPKSRNDSLEDDYYKKLSDKNKSLKEIDLLLPAGPAIGRT